MPQITQLPILSTATDSTYFVVVDGNNTRRLVLQRVVDYISETDLRGPTGPQGPFGPEGVSGKSGFSGRPGSIGLSGFSGYTGQSGYSGFSGQSGYSGFSGRSGYSGFSGRSGYSGFSGRSGFSGYSGDTGFSGHSGFSGYSGVSRQCFILSLGAEDTAVTTGYGQFLFRAPYNFILTDVRAVLSTAQISGDPIAVDVFNNGSSIFSTYLTIDNSETTSVTSSMPSVISNTMVYDNDALSVNVLAVGDGTATGLKIYLIGVV